MEKHIMGIKDLLEGGLDEALCPGVVKQRLYRAGELLALPTKEGYISLHYACGAGVNELGDLQRRFREPTAVKRIIQIILSHPEVCVDAAGE